MYNLPPTNRALCFVSLTLYPCANKTNEVVSCVPRSTLPPLLLCRSGVFRPAALGGDDDDGQSCQHDCKECAPGWSICRNPPRMAPVCLAWLTDWVVHTHILRLACYLCVAWQDSLSSFPPTRGTCSPFSGAGRYTYSCTMVGDIAYIGLAFNEQELEGDRSSD